MAPEAPITGTIEPRLKLICKALAASPLANTVNQVLGEYRGLSPKIPALNGGMCLALARTYWQNGKPDLAADYVSLAHQRGGHSYAMAKLLNEMIPYYQRRQKTEQAAKLTAILKRLRPSITAPGPVQAD